MQTATKSLEQWLSECPDDYAFYCRFMMLNWMWKV